MVILLEVDLVVDTTVFDCGSSTRANNGSNRIHVAELVWRIHGALTDGRVFVVLKIQVRVVASGSFSITQSEKST